MLYVYYFLWEGFHINIHSLTFFNSWCFHWNLLDHSHCFVAAPSGSVLNWTKVLLKFFYCLLNSVSFFSFFLSFILRWNILRTICTRHQDKYIFLFVLGSFYGPGWISAILLRPAVQFHVGMSFRRTVHIKQIQEDCTANMCSGITVKVHFKNCNVEKLQFFTVDLCSLYFLQIKNCDFNIIFM